MIVVVLAIAGCGLACDRLMIVVVLAIAGCGLACDRLMIDEVLYLLLLLLFWTIYVQKKVKISHCQFLCSV